MIHDKLKEELKEALKAKETTRLSVIRGLLSSFTNELVSQKKPPQGELSDEEALNVIKRASKQRKDSIEQFVNGGRPELAEKEKEELAILMTYLPAEMDEIEIKEVIEKLKQELGVSSKGDMGKLMSAVMQELKGKADGSIVKKLVESVLK